MFEETKKKMEKYIRWDGDRWVLTEEAPEKISAVEVLAIIADFVYEIEEECMSVKEFDKHYHIEQDAVAREVKFTK